MFIKSFMDKIWWILCWDGSRLTCRRLNRSHQTLEKNWRNVTSGEADLLATGFLSFPLSLSHTHTILVSFLRIFLSLSMYLSMYLFISSNVFLSLHMSSLYFCLPNRFFLRICLSLPAWPVENCQISIKVAKNDFTRKIKDFHTITKLPKNAGDLGKLIVAKGLKSCPKSDKSLNLVTLTASSSASKIRLPLAYSHPSTPNHLFPCRCIKWAVDGGVVSFK